MQLTEAIELGIVTVDEDRNLHCLQQQKHWRQLLIAVYRA